MLVQVDLDKLERLASELVARLPHAVVVGLTGTLGAGKTRLVQAIANASGVPRELVTSPTFTIVQHYHGTRLIHHVDAYRLADEDEFIELGGEELLDEDAMILIEWPERITRCLPDNIIAMQIEVDDAPGTRTIFAACRNATLMRLVDDAFRAAETV